MHNDLRPNYERHSLFAVRKEPPQEESIRMESLILFVIRAGFSSSSAVPRGLKISAS